MGKSKSVTVWPGPKRGTVRSESGEVLEIPDGWELLPPGDAGLTRRVKAGGPSWTVKEKKGRRTYSRGVWAPAERIAKARAALEAERATPEYARKREADARRRDRQQADYVREFERHVRAFLGFHERHAGAEAAMARAIAEHATPVGSGTVARTKRIPVAERAEAATIAWMRHQTTGYDSMHIPRDKGARREVRRKLAARSRELLERYRSGAEPARSCPLLAALEQLGGSQRAARKTEAGKRAPARRKPASRAGRTTDSPAPARAKQRRKPAARAGSSARPKASGSEVPKSDDTAAVRSEREERQARVRERLARRRRGRND